MGQEVFRTGEKEESPQGGRLKKNYKVWMNSEVKALKDGIVPPGRSIRSIKVFCYRNKIKVPESLNNEK